MNIIAPTKQEQPRPQASGVHRYQKLLLLVENHQDTRDMYRFVLEAEGYRVAEATDGLEAVSLAKSLAPNLILMDSVMPGLDGVMAMTRIRQVPALQNVPVVFVSGQAESRRQREALAAGADDYLVKPVCLETLKTTIATHLLKHKRVMYGTQWAMASG